jgi:ankyrin repeat protein
VDQKQENEATLRLAAERGQHDAVQVMVDLGADPAAADRTGRTALHAAAAEGQLAVVEQLLELGVDPSPKDGDGRTPFELAEAAGFGDVMDVLRAAR